MGAKSVKEVELFAHQSVFVLIGARLLQRDDGDAIQESGGQWWAFPTRTTVRVEDATVHRCDGESLHAEVYGTQAEAIWETPEVYCVRPFQGHRIRRGVASAT
jgi:hypothetical protein